jgi:hypothetical protein
MDKLHGEEGGSNRVSTDGVMTMGKIQLLKREDIAKAEDTKSV